MTREFGLGPAILFCPADRPDRYAKALERADAVILDLEDAVAASERDAARETLVRHQLDPERVIVRVNPAGTPDFAADLAAVGAAGYGTVMLAKTSSRADVDAVAAADRNLAVVALCESAAGVLVAAEIAAAAQVVALMWGAEDLIASLGGSTSRHADGRYRSVADHARSTVLLAAGAHGKAAIDTVHLDIADVDGLRAEAEDGAASGFVATACIHPAQVDVVRAAYRPDSDTVANARAMLSQAAQHSGVFRFGDLMVDGPVLRHAEAIIRRAEA